MIEHNQSTFVSVFRAYVCCCQSQPGNFIFFGTYVIMLLHSALKSLTQKSIRLIHLVEQKTELQFFAETALFSLVSLVLCLSVRNIFFENFCLFCPHRNFSTVIHLSSAQIGREPHLGKTFIKQVSYPLVSIFGWLELLTVP